VGERIACITRLIKRHSSRQFLLPTSSTAALIEAGFSNGSASLPIFREYLFGFQRTFRDDPAHTFCRHGTGFTCSPPGCPRMNDLGTPCVFFMVPVNLRRIPRRTLWGLAALGTTAEVTAWPFPVPCTQVHQSSSRLRSLPKIARWL
jgi:hypothetical protein